MPWEVKWGLWVYYVGIIDRSWINYTLLILKISMIKICFVPLNEVPKKLIYRFERGLKHFDNL